MFNGIKNIIIALALAIIFVGLVFLNNSKMESDSLEEEHLVVYSCLRGEETKSILELFKKETGCSYEYIQLPTEEAVNRIKDEKNNPKADIFLSGTSSSLTRLSESNDIIRFVSKYEENISPKLKDEYGRWVAFEFHPFAIVINKESSIEVPNDFKDLGDEKYKGKIIMPNPLTSGTGYSFISYLYSRYGEEEANKLVEDIKLNSGFLATRGYNVVQNVASGEYPIGIAYLSNIDIMARTVDNLKVVVPEDTGIDIHGVGIINKKEISKASREFVNFIISSETQKKLENISSAIPAIRYDEYKDSYKFINFESNPKGINIWKRIK